jgi:hypothetical protein
MAGGLGNQLFQVALALKLAQFNRVHLVYGVHPTRKGFVFTEQFIDSLRSYGIEVVQSNNSRVYRKLCNFLLRLSTSEGRYINGVVGLLNKSFSTLSRCIPNLKVMHVNNGIGFDAHLKINSSPKTVIGYMQTYEYASSNESRNILGRLLDQVPSSYVQGYLALAEREKPLVVHVRLGDYMLDPNFGFLDANYFYNHVKEAWKSGIYGKIWIFTDSPDVAQNMIKIDFTSEIRWITHPEDSAIDLLNVMRLGHGYVLSNSTFGWWAAFLKKNVNASTRVPGNWYSGKDSPIGLTPNSWIKCY